MHLIQVATMRFLSHRPDRPLSDFVENLWLRDGDLRIYTARHPDRCTHLPGAVVSGPYGGYFNTDRAAEASVMAVGFKPGGAFPFLGLGADELLDTHASLQDIW